MKQQKQPPQTTLYLHGIGLRRGEVPSWDEYPFSLPAIRRLKDIQLTSPVTFLVGENGSGKSTLLEAIASSWASSFARRASSTWPRRWTSWR